ncbi:Origin recognition complex subunit 3, partial [Spiromyces aspiralis]
IDGVDHFDYDGFRPLISGREGIDMLRLRHRLFQQSWNAIESVVENLLAEINEKGLAEIANFVNQAYDTNDVEHPGFVSLPFQELPTAVVFAGTNVSDHDHLFGLLYQYLAQASSGQATHRVALLQSKHCATLRGMLKSFMQQIQSDSDNSNSSDEARNSKGGTVSAPTRGGGKPLAHDMQILEGWYSDYERRTHSRPKLVAIVQDFEGFPPAVIEDFISICGQYCDRIPIVLVIGLATSYDTLGQTLSKSGMGRLDIKRFSLQRSNDVIDKVVEKVLVSDCSGVGFMLGYDPYRYLLDQYLLHSYSVTSFLAQLKYAAMHHFYANPLSVLHAAMARTKVS